MKKGIVIYCSKTGTTKKFGENISSYLSQKNAETNVVSIDDFNEEMLTDRDFVLFGCWTHGLMIFLQHPDKPWVEFIKTFPAIKNKKVGLFATYKVATGSMFKKMKKHLGDRVDTVEFELKSKRGELSEKYHANLDALVN